MASSTAPASRIPAKDWLQAAVVATAVTITSMAAGRCLNSVACQSGSCGRAGQPVCMAAGVAFSGAQVLDRQQQLTRGGALQV